MRLLTESSPELRQQRIGAADPLWFNGCVSIVGGKERRPDAGSVLRFSAFSKFLIPIRINQNVSGRALWRSRDLQRS